uniref:Uncharacterized protein AlNc14C1G127 n=1 Tax=Albugo laibachii Nc14 TaxID=890382 RepID=F0VYX6_9STRA|nr:conserved hypothetical protein [Albugo laibachii Nc14]|eukprot:CCA13991.1 conserved hypothetical protein [Albugo laibachii Nc14]
MLSMRTLSSFNLQLVPRTEGALSIPHDHLFRYRAYNTMRRHTVAIPFVNTPLSAPYTCKWIRSYGFKSNGADTKSEDQFLRRFKSHLNDPNLKTLALEWIVEMQREESRNLLTENVATALIEILSSLKCIEEAVKFLKYARDRSVRPRIHAYSSIIAASYEEEDFTLALRVFEVCRNDGYVPGQVTYSRALSAAHKVWNHELVLEIFDDVVQNGVDINIVIINNVLSSCARVGDADFAMELHRYVSECKIPMTSSTCHSLSIIGGKSGRWELAMEAYNTLVNSGFQITTTICKSVISACSKGRKWQKVIDMYESMEPSEQDMIVDAYFSAVLQSYASVSKEPEAFHRVLKLYRERRALGQKMTTFTHNVILKAHMNLSQFDEFFGHLETMKADGVSRDEYTRKLIIITHIKMGNPQLAVKQLRLYGYQLGFSADCYRELIRHYGDVEDYQTACRWSNKMMQDNPLLQQSDWEIALSNSLQLYDQEPKLYWNFRRWMLSRSKYILANIPKGLMLPIPQSPNDVGYRAYHGSTEDAKPDANTAAV